MDSSTPTTAAASSSTPKVTTGSSSSSTTQQRQQQPPRRRTHYGERIFIPSIYHKRRTQREEFRAWMDAVFSRTDFSSATTNYYSTRRNINSNWRVSTSHGAPAPADQASNSISTRQSACFHLNTNSDNARRNFQSGVTSSSSTFCHLFEGENDNENENDEDAEDFDLLLLKVNAVRWQMIPHRFDTDDRLNFEAFSLALNCLSLASQHRFFDLYGGQPGSFTLKTLAVYLEAMMELTKPPPTSTNSTNIPRISSALFSTRRFLHRH